MDSLEELFALPRYTGTLAALVRCTNVTSGFNQRWMKQNKTGTWPYDPTKRKPQTIIVLIDSDDVKVDGVVEIWAGRFKKWTSDRKNSESHRGFFHVDCFEKIGITSKVGLQEFCAPYCKGPQPVPVYLQSNGSEVQNSSVRPSAIDIKDDFSPEFSGEKEGGSPGKYTANCTHGKIITALHGLLKQERQNCKITNRSFFDLLVEDEDKCRTLFEVKSNDATQSVYTGIGQLSIYNLKAQAQKGILVLPNVGLRWKPQLENLNIQLWTYEITDEDVIFLRP